MRPADPADCRATIANFTPRGWRLLRDPRAIKQEHEAEYAAIVGEDGLQTLRTLHTTLLTRPERAE